MKYFLPFILVTLLFSGGCKKESPSEQEPLTEEPFSFISGADLSFLPEIESAGTVFYDSTGKPEDVLTTFQKNGVNTIRIRLWHTPATAHSGFEEVKTFATRVKAKKMKVWLTVHYSDTWADPGNQTIPAAWKSLTFQQLKDSVDAYTRKIVKVIQPDIIQIGNEINPGFLWPMGKLEYKSQFLELLDAGCKAARAENKSTQIMIHLAGLDNADWYFSQFSGLDYDLIGLSYYPIWHGKDLAKVYSTLNQLNQKYKKKVVIAETAYPFTTGWNDWTDNIFGSPVQVLSAYPPTQDGQYLFLLQIKSIVRAVNGGYGFCYWGGEWVSFRGNQAKNGSSWENMALYDFSNLILPAIQAFNAAK